jgi:hypothetical protein
VKKEKRDHSGDEHVNVSFSMPIDLSRDAHARAAKLGLKFSEYMRLLISDEFGKSGGDGPLAITIGPKR